MAEGIHAGPSPCDNLVITLAEFFADRACNGRSGIRLGYVFGNLPDVSFSVEALPSGRTRPNT
jgi:hypothetical protein